MILNRDLGFFTFFSPQKVDNTLQEIEKSIRLYLTVTFIKSSEKVSAELPAYGLNSFPQP